ncbi:MAG TPA: lipid-A-disaccharide synthase [Bryobacteraceae bacterium]|nr:lipid-A-disaccharide synthase [Bryobacteraceae bacterium]
MRFLISAGEASGDMYAARLVAHLQSHYASAEFYGCAGPRLQALGVQPVIDSAKLAVVGLAEVVGHLPRIYGEYRKLISFVRKHPPDAAILTDSPDFHLRLARHLKLLKVPVFYLVAPQVWAWRQGRVKTIRQRVDQLFCLFPFEEGWFRERQVDATYIGHPLAQAVRTRFSREEFLARHNLPPDHPLLVLLPGSRTGEAHRHLPVLLDAVELLQREFSLTVLLATPHGFYNRADLATFRERFRARSINIIENETWDSIGHSSLALAASGTVTVEAAILGTPMVTFYKVSSLTWRAGRRLVKAPFLSMVNLIAGRKIVPELIQNDMTASSLASEAANLLRNPDRAAQMRTGLAAVRAALTFDGDPLRRAADLIVNSIASRDNSRTRGEEFVL